MAESDRNRFDASKVTIMAQNEGIKPSSLDEYDAGSSLKHEYDAASSLKRKYDAASSLKRKSLQDTEQEPSRKKSEFLKTSESSGSKTDKYDQVTSTTAVGKPALGKPALGKPALGKPAGAAGLNSPPKLKFGFGTFGNKNKSTTEGSGDQMKMAPKPSPGPVKMTLGAQKKDNIPVKPKVATRVSSVFGQDDESDEEEEMPPEAKMRMKNIGRDTPTAAGPNSFGKSKMGFCDRTKMIEKQLIKMAEDSEKDDKR